MDKLLNLILPLISSGGDMLATTANQGFSNAVNLWRYDQLLGENSQLRDRTVEPGYHRAEALLGRRLPSGQTIGAGRNDPSIRPAFGPAAQTVGQPGGFQGFGHKGAPLNQGQKGFGKSKIADARSPYTSGEGDQPTYAGNIGTVAGEMDRLVGGYGDRAARFGGESGALRRDVTGGYADRLNTGMGMLDRYGVQQRQNIRQDFQNLGARNQQDLTSRGLTGTTALSGMRRGVAREEQRSLGDLEQRIIQDRTNLYTNLSGQSLQARERMGANDINFRSGLAADTLSMQERGFQNRQVPISDYLGTTERLGDKQEALDIFLAGQKMNIIGGREDLQPNMAGFNQRMMNAGRGFAPAPSAPKDNSLLGAGIGAGGTVGGMALGATILAAGACMDATTLVMTPGGPKRMLDIKDGDQVMDENDTFREVLFIDYCLPHGDRPNDYVQIITEGGFYVRCTLDHILEGKPANRWQPGEVIGGKRIRLMQLVTPFMSSDILLPDGLGYWAGGIRVASMIAARRLNQADMLDRRQRYTTACAAR